TKLEVKIAGGSGDLDLYTKQGTPPDTGSYTCRPYIGGNNETCTHTNPAEGSWYVMVRGYSSGSSTLTATYTTGSGGSDTELSNGVPEAVSLATGAEKLYFIQVPPDTTELEVKIAGGSGDLDLYTKHGTPPDTGSYTCRPYIGGNNETCTHTNPAEGSWYVMVRGYSTGNATLTATYGSSTGDGIDSGQLPTANMVWSSWYWPMANSLNPNLYDDNEALHRYDLYVGGASDAQRWEYNQHGPPQNPEGWWGHCHAWAAAACWEDQPAQSTTLGSVTFRVRDRKGLMIEAYYKSANGSSYELFHNDPSPGVFWKYLQDEIAGANPIHGEAVGFIGELYYGDQVWNHPIYAYEVEYAGSGTVSGKITISYATDFEPFMADSTSLYSDTLTYYFKDVFLSGSTPTDSGTWILEDGSLPSATAYDYSRHRPDAIWRPYKASSWTTYAENPYLDSQNLSDILDQ
ncbi:MAG: hypothetical protein D3923_05795, partial [Candidatus Electrothrix sp. AR3]|nr:hypothetical protein [Candidatus Electrothrix sp. AR3]